MDEDAKREEEAKRQIKIRKLQVSLTSLQEYILENYKHILY